jgi:hypothetical protein
MKRKIANFNSFMKNRLNEMEETDNQFAMGMDAYAEAPEEDMEDDMEDDPDLDMEEEGDEEELTMEDLKAIVDDLEDRLSALEGGDEEDEEEEEEGDEEEEEEDEEEEEEEEEEEI